MTEVLPGKANSKATAARRVSRVMRPELRWPATAAARRVASGKCTPLVHSPSTRRTIGSSPTRGTRAREEA